MSPLTLEEYLIRWLVGCTCAIVVAAAGSVVAHHSSAGIDRTKSVTVAGTIKESGGQIHIPG